MSELCAMCQAFLRTIDERQPSVSQAHFECAEFREAGDVARCECEQLRCSSAVARVKREEQLAVESPVQQELHRVFALHTTELAILRVAHVTLQSEMMTAGRATP